MLVDMQSRSDTHVDGIRVTSPTPIGPDDRIRVGSFRLRVRGMLRVA